MQWIMQIFQSPVMTMVMRFITGWGNLGALWICFAFYFYLSKKIAERRCFCFWRLS